jgi:prefoldin subunit 5
MNEEEREEESLKRLGEILKRNTENIQESISEVDEGIEKLRDLIMVVKQENHFLQIKQMLDI